MHNTTKASIALGLLAVHIAAQDVHFPDKNILAIGYLATAVSAIHLGKGLVRYREDILKAVYLSALIVGCSTIIFLGILPYSAHGLAGWVGNKNLVANWLACGIVAGLSFGPRTNFTLVIGCAFLFIIGAFTGSKAFFLYLILIVWMWKGEKHAVN